MSHDEPCRNDGNSPKSKVHIDTSMLRKDRDRLQPIADGLPSTLRAAQEPRVSNDQSLIGSGKILYNKVTEGMKLLAVLIPGQLGSNKLRIMLVL